MEIEIGILKKRRTDQAQASLIDGWFQTARRQFQSHTVVFDSAAAQAAAPLWLMRTRGTVDTLIAATALAGGFDLVTRNVKDFADIPGLTLINPWEQAVG
jgi:predicted nucleic acid-binding protein